MEESEEKIFPFLFSGKEQGPRRGYKNITRGTFRPRNSCSKSLLRPVGKAGLQNMQFIGNDLRLGSLLLFLAQIENQMVPACHWSEMRKA